MPNRTTLKKGSLLNRAIKLANMYGGTYDNNSNVVKQYLAKLIVGKGATIGKELWDDCEFLKIHKADGRTLISKKGTQGVLLEEVVYDKVIPLGIYANAVNTQMSLVWKDRSNQCITFDVPVKKLTSNGTYVNVILLISKKEKKFIDLLAVLGEVYITEKQGGLAMRKSLSNTYKSTLR